MTARFEQAVPGEDESFYIGVFQDNLETISWHYHNNCEISFITEGSGRRIVADSIEEFQPGDLVFLGSNLPHVWLAEKDPGGLSGRSLEMVYLQFAPEIVFPMLLKMPEFSNVRKAMEAAVRGVQVSGETLNRVSELMLRLPYMKGFDRMEHFYRMMNIIGESTTNVPLASEDYMQKHFRPANRRIALLHDYLMRHYREEIALDELAALVHMAEGSLCRYFRMQTGISVFGYLNRLKVDFACRLLMDPEMGITEVCFDSGFNNLSHFNRQFLRHTGLTPTRYREKNRWQV